MRVVDNVLGAVGGVQSAVTTKLHERLVQVSLFAGILFYVLANGVLLDKVQKLILSVVKVKVSKDVTLVLHAVLFMVIMFFTTKYLFDPIFKALRLTEGMANKRPANKKPVSKKPVAKRVVAKKPAAKGSIGKRPVAKRSPRVQRKK